MNATAIQLQSEIDALRAQVADSTARLADATSQLSARDARIRQLEELILTLRHRQFGASSEQIAPGQASLFDEPAAPDEEAAQADATVTVPAHQRQVKRRPRLSPDLPRVDVVHDLPEAEKVCPDHGCALEPMGDAISERLRFIPATVEVERHVCRKYACPHCEGRIVTAAKPAQLIPKSIATPSLLAWVTVSKYADALPLYRQSSIFARLGIELDRTTMARWMLVCGEAVQPLINLLWDRVRQASVVHMDETRVQVLDEPGKTPQSPSYLWVAAAGSADATVVVFHYTPGRTQATPKVLLEGYQGALMVDGYEAYDAVCRQEGLVRLGCWAHARRKFVEAQRLQPKGKTGKPDQALALIGQLYQVERKLAQTRDPDAIRGLRDTQARPVLARLRQWLEKSLPLTTPGSKLGAAMTYLHNQWPRLSRYLDDGTYPIDNNRAENAIRPFVIGRKNWIFSQSVAGVQASANLYSLIETAKGHGLDPYQYLMRVFTQLPNAKSVEDFEALLPDKIKYGD
ncbi:MAG: IS66 family transposase [Pseudomonadales bacterium]